MPSRKGAPLAHTIIQVAEAHVPGGGGGGSAGGGRLVSGPGCRGCGRLAAAQASAPPRACWLHRLDARVSQQSAATAAKARVHAAEHAAGRVRGRRWQVRNFSRRQCLRRCGCHRVQIRLPPLVLDHVAASLNSLARHLAGARARMGDARREMTKQHAECFNKDERECNIRVRSEKCSRGGGVPDGHPATALWSSSRYSSLWPPSLGVAQSCLYLVGAVVGAAGATVDRAEGP